MGEEKGRKFNRERKGDKEKKLKLEIQRKRVRGKQRYSKR